jgi:phage shock protein A
MGIFTRVRDIISSNINAMLDVAEDPEKLVRMMIREMEDTLVEVKASCASAMAAKKRIERDMESVRKRAGEWGDKAELAVSKGREDLAREALVEKRRYQQRAEGLQKELEQASDLVEQYQSDIQKLEEKLAVAREKERLLVQRHSAAQNKKRAESNIRKFETSSAFARFEQFEDRIEHMESEAELVNYGRKDSLDHKFRELDQDDDIERELDELKSKKNES